MAFPSSGLRLNLLIHTMARIFKKNKVPLMGNIQNRLTNRSSVTYNKN
jgi:hypothetical protein